MELRIEKITIRFCSAIQYYLEAIDSDSLIVNSLFFLHAIKDIGVKTWIKKTYSVMCQSWIGLPNVCTSILLRQRGIILTENITKCLLLPYILYFHVCLCIFHYIASPMSHFPSKV